MDIIFAGGKFRAKSKFANIAKLSSTRKIGVGGLLVFQMGTRTLAHKAHKHLNSTPMFINNVFLELEPSIFDQRKRVFPGVYF